MALWFAELAARKILERGRQGDSFFGSNSFTSVRDSNNRMVIPLDDMAALGLQSNL
jgi:hypothetical protein